MNFYDDLKKYRKLKGFTIHELSERSGVSSAYISQIENGNRGIPSPEVLRKLSEGLNISYSELMQVAGYMESDENDGPKQEVHVNLRRFLRENELIFDGIELTPDDKEWIERVLTALFWQRKKSNTQSSNQQKE